MTTATQAPGYQSVRRGGGTPGGPARTRPEEHAVLLPQEHAVLLVDMDALPADLMVKVAVDRLLQLRRGEQAELRSGSNPRRMWRVWREVDRLIPAAYGFAYLQDGPDRWRVQVTHRTAP